MPLQEKKLRKLLKGSLTTRIHYEEKKHITYILFVQISSRRRKTDFPPKGSWSEGEWDPENFREIQVGEILFHLARILWNAGMG